MKTFEINFNYRGQDYTAKVAKGINYSPFFEVNEITPALEFPYSTFISNPKTRLIEYLHDPNDIEKAAIIGTAVINKCNEQGIKLFE